MIFQNAKFDLHILAGEGIEWPAGLRIEDTMVQSFVLDPSEAHGMDAMSEKYLNYTPKSFAEVLGEERENFSEVPIAEAAFYSAEDAVVTWRLFELFCAKLKNTLSASGVPLWQVYDEIDRPLVQVLFEIERTGVFLDAAPLLELSRQLKTELAQKEMAALQILKDYGVEQTETLNLGSPKQMADVLYEKLKLPVLKRGKTGPSTDVKVLEELSHQHPFPRALVEIRELAKLLSTYVDALPELVDARTHRLHTDFSQVIAATGRLSSSKPNLQNIPIRTERGRKIREAFRAASGNVLVGIDYSQVELRLLAHISQDVELLRAFREGADIHKRTAALILQKSESEINDEERRMAKTINFGIVYGQTAFGLSKTLGIARGDAQKFIEAYFVTYPGIRVYMDRAIAEARQTGQVTTLTGRRRPLAEINSKNGALRQFAERMAINSPIQGTAADLMKAAMIRAYYECKKSFPNAKMVLQVHDELLFEVKKEQAEELRLLAKKIMEDPELLKTFGVKNFSVEMKTESASGEHWGDL